MNRWTSRTRLALSALALASLTTSLVCISACGTSSKSVSARGTDQAVAAMYASKPAPNELSPIGQYNNSNQLTPSLSEGDFASAVTVKGNNIVPSIDLQNVLQNNQGGGGGSSPFSNPDDDFSHGFQTRRRPLDWAIPDGPPRRPAAEPAPPERAYGHVKQEKPAPAAPAQAGAMQFSLRPGQELLIIERPTNPDRYARPANDDFPGFGTLMTRWSDPNQPNQPERELPVPLKHTDVHASITGPISSVQVTQQFTNPFSTKIEAVYVFPLPDDAAVNDFVMTIGPRSIRGVIREREQAQQIYQQARNQGYHASLMSQERSNIFTQHVANIAPGEQVDISITYFGALNYHEGGYEFVFPMVVGPRYNPASTWVSPRSAWGSDNAADNATRSAAVPNTGIGAIPAYSPPSGQPTDVSYLRPQDRSGSDISLSIDLNAGVRLEAVDSPSHHISVQTGPTPERAAITLSPSDSIPNRDFVLRYRVAGGEIRAGMITAHDDRSGDNFFTMVLVPPSDLSYCPRGPVEMVFVIDCSGSMDGQPLELAKRCVRTALPLLRSTDSVQIIRFSDRAEFMTSSPVSASPENISRADAWVANLRASGGTELLNGLEPALESRADWKRSRFICLLSDGLLGNEPEVLGQLARKLGDSRVFTVAIGSAPNRTLMNAIARLGRGVAAAVNTPDDADQAMTLFSQRVQNAAMTNLDIDFGNLNAKDIYPKRLPDLYVGRPVIITGRFSGTANPGTNIRVTGRAGEQRQTLDVPIVWSDPLQSRALPLSWARAKITDLDEQSSWGRTPGAGSTQGPNHAEIKDLALRYGLMSAYTSFVAVDCAQRTAGSYGTTVAVPVNMPQGTRYETTVPER